MKKLRLPTLPTLKKYGLSGKDWYDILERQFGYCPVCNRKFSEELRPVIDHYHAKGFKKMTPQQKSKQVRGLLCRYCNQRRVTKGMTFSIAWCIWAYLEQFEARCDE